MRFLSIVLISLCTAIYSNGQNDPDALTVLDKFSAAALSSPSVSIKFMAITLNAQDNSRDTVNGFLLMQKDQYRLELPDNITWFNGSVSWNYLVNEKEVTITKPGRKDESFFTKPSSLFSLYKKGYKLRLIESNEKNSTVDLYPEDINNEMVRVRLVIGRILNNLISAEYKKKDGITVFLSVKEYNLQKIPDASAFTFNPKNYKGLEIIDMR